MSLLGEGALTQHPQNINHLASRQNNQNSRKTQNTSQKNDRLPVAILRKSNTDNDIDSQYNSSRENNGTDQIDKHRELHRQASNTTEIRNKHKLHKVVHCRVNPSTTLRQKHGECIRYNGLAHCLRHEHHLTLGEGSKHKCGQETIFTKEQQVLFMQGSYDVLVVFENNIRVGKNRNP